MVMVIPFENLSSGSFCSDCLVAFWGCRLATSLTWLKCRRQLFNGLVGWLVSCSMFPSWTVRVLCGVVASVMGHSMLVSCAGTGGGSSEVGL